MRALIGRVVRASGMAVAIGLACVRVASWARSVDVDVELAPERGEWMVSAHAGRATLDVAVPVPEVLRGEPRTEVRPGRGPSAIAREVRRGREHAVRCARHVWPRIAGEPSPW